MQSCRSRPLNNDWRSKMKSLLAVKAEPRIRDEAGPLLIYAVSNNERSNNKIMFMGIYGDYAASDDRYPFVLLADGRIDFGAELAGRPDRFFQTNFRCKRMEQGELFSVIGRDPEQGGREYEIVY